MAKMIENEAMFKTEVLESDKPVLVDFFATWCGPCKMLSPVVEAVAEERADKVKVFKLDIDELGGIAMDYNVMAVPTLMLFKNGEAVDTKLGVCPKDELISFISQ